jgi:hypothetical protein
MCGADWTRVLQAIGQAYPDGVDAREATRLTGDAEHLREALRELVGRGLVDDRLGAGLSSRRLHLTEAGLAVACGLVRIEDDAGAALAAREAGTVRDLQRMLAGRTSRCG